VGYGAYVPRYRLPAKEVARVWTGGQGALPIKEKAVPGLDEDVVTMSIEAARNAMKRAGIPPSEVRAVWVGSESHPYAVKPTSTLVAEAIGAVPNVQAADWQFACKAGTEAMVAAIGFVGSGMARYAMAIGMDTAQGKPGDALEYTAGAGGAAFLLGGAQEALAVIDHTYSYVTDTPDSGGGNTRSTGTRQRFTGEPAYFKHITEAGKVLSTPVELLRLTTNMPFPPAQYEIPQRVAEMLGFSQKQIEAGLLVPVIAHLCWRSNYRLDRDIGYRRTRGSHLDGFLRFWSRLGCLCAHGHRAIRERRDRAPHTQDYIARRTEIDYAAMQGCAIIGNA